MRKDFYEKKLFNIDDMEKIVINKTYIFIFEKKVMNNYIK